MSGLILRGVRSTALLGLGLCWVVMLPAASRAEPATEKTEAVLEPIPLTDFLDFVPTAQERRRYRTLQRSFNNANNAQGAWRSMRGWKGVLITPRQAYIRALRKNLSLRIAGLDADKARLALQQAEAVFDPTFVVSVGRTESVTYERRRSGTVYLRNLQPLTGSNSVLTIPITSSVVDGYPKMTHMGYLQQSSGYTTRSYRVHSGEANGPLETRSVTVAIRQQLPWGPQLSLTQSASMKETYYDSRRNAFQRPWGAALALNLWMPLPYMKGFGRMATQDVALRQAEINRARGDAQLDAFINGILAQVDSAYWDSAEAFLRLLAAVDNRYSAQVRYGHLARMVAEQQARNYDRQQMAVELKQRQIQEEEARQALATASLKLGVLIEEQGNALEQTLILPIGFDHLLKSPPMERLELDLEPLTKQALAQRPEMKMADFHLKADTLEHRYRKHQSRPDLSLSADFSHSQDNSTYGYRSMTQAMSVNLTEPDTQAMSTTVNFKRVLGHRAAEGQVTLAGINLEGRKLDRDAVSHSIVREVYDAVSGLLSSQQREEAAQTALHLANDTLSHAKRIAENKGSISEWELIVKSQDVHQAKLAHLTAQMDRRRAYSKLLAARGLLTQEAALQGTVNAFDQYRIRLLGKSRGAPRFLDKIIHHHEYW
ncbi:MAG: TolC family protein [Magnetococcales bacterium]|nr:TolC family protein [Magnetococcales bacterium]